MRDAGAFLCLPFPAGDNEVTSYNVFGFFLSHPPPSTFCCPLLVFSPLGHRHSCSRLPAGMAGVSGAWPGAETSLCLMGWWDAASGLAGDHIPPCLLARWLSLMLPLVETGRSRSPGSVSWCFHAQTFPLLPPPDQSGISVTNLCRTNRPWPGKGIN